MIERAPITSSNIKSIGYDKETKTLAVEFAGGNIYHYDNVDQQAYDDLAGAKSVGSHFSKNFRGVYKFSKQ